MRVRTDKAVSQLKNLKQARKSLTAALEAPDTDLNRDAAIQRFEFTFELSWKLMQSVAKENLLPVVSVRDSIRAGAKLGLINSPERWFEFLESRNLTSHTYHEEVAIEVYEMLPDFLPLVETLIRNTNTTQSPLPF